MTYKLYRLVIAVIIPLLFVACSGEEDSDNIPQAPLEPYQIEEVQIGSQVWSNKNLNTLKFRNGDNIRIAEDTSEWAFLSANGTPACAYPYFNKDFGYTYGLIYNWYAVNDARGLAPDGWKVASTSDWNALFQHVRNDIQSDYESNSLEMRPYFFELERTGLQNPYFLNIDYAVAYSLKSKESWYDGVFPYQLSVNDTVYLPAGNGIDRYGFAVLPIGRMILDGFYFNTNNATGWQWASFWTSTEMTDSGFEDFSYFTRFNAINQISQTAPFERAHKGVGFSVRMVKE